MSGIYVFLGPTLWREQAAAVLEATYLPPVAQGDVYRIARRRPRAIGIVDGYFSGAPSVWHKEILWALSERIPVFGSASMGALRAAELHGLGMHGVGRIFEDFRDGILEDDDEVAVVHGPREARYVAASEPMVNIRATLAWAETEGVLQAATRRTLESFAKSVFFADREWPLILDGAHGVAADDIERLRRFLPNGRVDQKRADALEMLAAMRDFLAHPAVPEPHFRFARTHFFDELAARCDAETQDDASGASLPARAVLEELRLEGADSYDRARTRALLRRLAGREARRLGLTATLESKRAALGRLRKALGLFTRAELDAWLARNHLDAAALENLVADQALCDAALDVSGAPLDGALLDELRSAGAYERMAARARRKREALTDASVETDARAAGPTLAELRLWYFERRIGQSFPDDIKEFARNLGFVDVAEFDSAVRREWLYVQMVEETNLS